jgi:hypothetical protein
VDAFAISTMPAKDATADVLTEYELPAEMSGTGEIVDGTVHVHAMLAVEGDRAPSGHLHRAGVRTSAARSGPGRGVERAAVERNVVRSRGERWCFWLAVAAVVEVLPQVSAIGQPAWILRNV